MVDFKKINKRIAENKYIFCGALLGEPYDTQGWHPEYNYDNKVCSKCNRKHMMGLINKGFL